MLPDDSGIMPRVVKLELYETSSPPGNNGGAVSGAAPCPLSDGTQSKVANDKSVHFPQWLRSGLWNFKTLPPDENVVVHTKASAGRPTGGQAKYEEEGSNPSERQVGSVTDLR